MSETFFRHDKMPRWGTGILIRREGEYLCLRFPGDEESKVRKFNASAVGSVLLPVEDVLPDDPVLDKDWQVAIGAVSVESKTTREAARCPTCSQLLTRSSYSQDQQWKSCPSCSRRAGEHVFYRSPDAFGTTDKRETEQNLDGVQSYCAACRKGEQPDLECHLCSELTMTAEQC